MSIKDRMAWRTRPPRGTDPRATDLHERGSLTSRLQRLGRFEVQRLRQGLSMPTFDEALALGIKRDRLAWVREVTLRVDDQALVFAHTVLPCRPRGPLAIWLSRLGNRSLGALLFAHPKFSRGVIRCKRLDHRHRLFRPAVEALELTGAAPAILWARRSRFSFGAQSVLVTEVFSPVLGRIAKPADPGI